MQTNCFAYTPNPKRPCRALIDHSGCGVTCPFYKTKAALKAGRLKAALRLDGLPEKHQLHIADTYFTGVFEWRKKIRRAECK